MNIITQVGSVVGKCVQVAVVPVAAGIVFTPAVGVAFAVGREVGWIGGRESAEKRSDVEAPAEKQEDKKVPAPTAEKQKEKELVIAKA